ncbi:Replication protein repB [Streptococcus pyogenes]|nr:Replication protein repB [Streptococcus pyogenes]
MSLLVFIRAYMLENIFDLYDFVEENGEAYGFTIKLVNEVIAGKTGFMKLLFDGAYQRRKRGGGKWIDTRKKLFILTRLFIYISVITSFVIENLNYKFIFYSFRYFVSYL